MLKKIVINNFKTFINSTEIDFSATNYKFLEEENVGNNRILKGCLFVGENASGKTQTLKAITFLLDYLFLNNNSDFVFNKSFYTDKDNYELKYYFDVDNNIVEYYLKISINKILEEKLVVNNKIIINRLGNNATINLKEEKIFDDLSDDLLFLRRVYFDTHFYDDKVLNKWFDYLKNSIYINCYDRRVINYNNKSLLSHNYLNENGAEEINKFLNKIGYNQEIFYDYKTPDANINLVATSNDNHKFISFKKKGTNIFIPEMFESTGNITLMEVLPSFLYAVNNDCMIILDEFGSGFHNELEECLIKYFFHYAKNSQLFFCSHSTNLLNNTILRPDQIYTVTFDSKKGSVIKRFSDEMPRELQNTEKMYLNGVFDGMPRYKKVFKD